MLKPGRYKASIVKHAITETKSGDPQAVVTFDFDADGNQQQMTWYGSFKEGKAREITIRALLVCGLKGNNPAGPLEIGREVMLTIESEKDQNGKERLRIRWINPLGGIQNALSDDMAKSKLSALEGAVMAARHGSGIADSDDDTIPF
jgi:hypothetical protein